MHNQREILFRGKTKDNGKWIEGYYVKSKYYEGGTTDFIIDVDNKYDDYDSFSLLSEVVPETVGQFTGLYDSTKWEDLNKEEQQEWLKHHTECEWYGKPIFEGDILSTTNSNCEIWYVDYKLTAFCANQGNANYSCVLDDFMTYSEVKIIGNVHDNPELLEK